MENTFELFESISFFLNLKKPKLLAKAQKTGRPTVQAQDRNPDQTDQDQLDPDLLRPVTCPVRFGPGYYGTRQISLVPKKCKNRTRPDRLPPPYVFIL